MSNGKDLFNVRNCKTLQYLNEENEWEDSYIKAKAFRREELPNLNVGELSSKIYYESFDYIGWNRPNNRIAIAVRIYW